MMHSTALLAFFVCIVISFNWTHAKKYEEIFRRREHILCSKCEDGNDVVSTPKLTFDQFLHYLVVNLSLDGDLPNTEEQLTLKNYVGGPCAICEVGYTACKPTRPKYQDCINKTAIFSIQDAEEVGNRTVTGSKIITKKLNLYNMYHTIDIPIGGLKNISRHTRSASTCLFPVEMNTAAITCKVYPSSISCVQRCAFGHTLQQGIRQEMSCNFKENKWVPTGFEECRPFVDCSLALLSGGKSICSSRSISDGPECRVECYHYEDKEAVPEQIYTCSIEGKWNPKLPFCVSADTGLMLVSPPKTKLHKPFERIQGSTEKIHGAEGQIHGVTKQ